MSIKTEDLNLLQGERQIKAEYVFFEKVDRPSSRNGSGITAGILLLTNRRLFFLSVMEGKSTAGKTAIKIATHIVTHLANHFTLGLASWVAYGIEKGFEHLTHENYEGFKLYAAKEGSFVIPIERIISCEKVGGTFSLSSKSRYTKIIISGEFGERFTYCIYSVDPKNQQSAIKYEKWFDEINDVRKVIEPGQLYFRSAYRYFPLIAKDRTTADYNKYSINY